ncbi:F-box domain [Arabidopsis suecica]|uniref:F-box domain n=1 Tax=Arabidopsis suecica TaxID=45249 RepID=A0A8T2H9M4_ARASU|nr:F-box domain [Arabidopsis suecica]
MANKEKLPWDLEEEILSRVPPTSLDRFKTVCKRWNALFNDKTFINNHKMTFQFVLSTRSKIYSVSVNPKVEVRELTLNNPGLKAQRHKNLFATSGLLLCDVGNGAVVWNPWLKQSRCIKLEVNEPSLDFLGIGYDNNKRVEEIVYKTLSVYMKDLGSQYTWKIHDFASDTWIDQEIEKTKYSRRITEGSVTIRLTNLSVVSLNGKFFKFCDLPSGKNRRRDALALRVFREDRFSLLRQCHVTKKIKIWVTKNKIDNRYGGDVKWMSFMEVSIPTMPDLEHPKFNSQPSYFIDDKRLVICSCDETGRAWIYVVGGNKLVSKTQLDSVVDPWPLHCTYFPSLVLVPGGQREEAELQEVLNL